MEISGAATPEFCEKLIKKYEADGRKQSARIGAQAEEFKEIRDSMNLEMNLLEDWKPEVDEMRNMIYSRVTKYLDDIHVDKTKSCLLYTSPSPRDGLLSRMPSSA